MLERIRAFVERHSAVLQTYLFLRQQCQHVRAGTAYLASRLGDGASSRRFVIFGRGRSGTTALVSLLNALPGVWCEGEILRNCLPFPHLHVRGRSALSREPVYGCKILSYQVRDVQRTLRAPTDFLRTLHYDDGFRILYLRRANLLRHALSNIRARAEGFSRKKGEGGTSSALRVDPDTVVEWMRSSEALQAYEHQLLEGVPHLSLTYEENIRDPSRHQQTVDDICEFLGIESAPVQTPYEKMAPPSLQDGVANYEALVERLDGTSYAQYLD